MVGKRLDILPHLLPPIFYHSLTLKKASESSDRNGPASESTGESTGPLQAMDLRLCVSSGIRSIVAFHFSKVALIRGANGDYGTVI